MKLTLSPMRGDIPLTLSRKGDIFTVNGEAFDFTALPDGATLPRAAVACDWLAGDVERIGGELHLPIILPHGSNAPEATLFAEPIPVTSDGPITLPPFDAEDVLSARSAKASWEYRGIVSVEEMARDVRKIQEELGK